jgi:hypothetical protein
MITEYLDAATSEKQYEGGLAFKPKRPATGRKPNPIEEMQRFISMSVFSLYLNHREFALDADIQD